MNTSQIEYFTIEQQNIVLNSLEKRLIKSCIDFNDKANNFVFEYDIKDNFIFCLLTCNTGSKIMPTMYRMLTVNAYSPTTDIYFDGNVCSGYTLNDVKEKTFNSLTYDLNKIKTALNK